MPNRTTVASGGANGASTTAPGGGGGGASACGSVSSGSSGVGGGVGDTVPQSGNGAAGGGASASAGVGATHSAVGETLFVNGVTYLCPPIYPAEMPSWSMLRCLPRNTKAPAKGHHSSAKEALAGVLALCASDGLQPEEVASAHGAPRPAAHPAEDKDGRAGGSSGAGGTCGEDGAGHHHAGVREEAVGERAHEDEVDELLREALPESVYNRLMVDMTRVACGCTTSQNLRSQSNLWPDDNHTHSLMTASPMALPVAAPFSLARTGERQLGEVSFGELLHYQERYGTAESLLSMLVRERQLSRACCYIFNEKLSRRLFVDVVAHHCLAHNQFHELQKVILHLDPSLRRVQEYLNVLKDFLRDRRALDLLYSYQVFTKDFVNAGLLAIQLFVASSTWDARVGHLQNAHAHLSLASRQLFGRRRGGGSGGGGHGEHHKGDGPGTDGAADVVVGSLAGGGGDGASHYGGIGGADVVLDCTSDLEVTESDIRRNLETVRLQTAICEAMPTEMPDNLDLFGQVSSQCEVAERLLVAGHFDLAQRVIDFLDLPAVELCVRASNQIATAEARSLTGSITPVVRFLEAIPKVPPVEWDSLVSNVVNIWIIEKAEQRADPCAAGQLIRFIHDERCRMDAHVLTGNLASAFQIAQRLGSLQDVLHIRSCAQRGGDQELLKHINSFLAYTSLGQDYLKKTLAL
eukprot:TRINITY_DN67031_c0_g1_i1.p1 TRINITY_DN67031_c0_g1~~TRINITY_DN67031_c0_g1_i1.p1  ORF type:complete len:804 (+),score=163.43 TRINITY_DN67031_c0_g1_i1:338-2413(+)